MITSLYVLAAILVTFVFGYLCGRAENGATEPVTYVDHLCAASYHLGAAAEKHPVLFEPWYEMRSDLAHLIQLEMALEAGGDYPNPVAPEGRPSEDRCVAYARVPDGEVVYCQYGRGHIGEHRSDAGHYWNEVPAT